MLGVSARVLSTGWWAAATILSPLLRLHLRRRARNGREILARLDERRGFDPTPRPDGPLIWLHAASVGEMVSILPLLPLLKTQTNVLVTTGTVTSQKLLDARLVQTASGCRIYHRFAPLDVPAWIDRFLSHWRPDAAAFVESELWPNQLIACQARGIPLMLINARMSERSFRTWQLVPGFARHVLGAFNRIQARSDIDAERLRALGAAATDSPGDLKFAAPPLPFEPKELSKMRGLLTGRPVWLAASTHPREETLIADAHHHLSISHPDLLTIIVPRHPERGPELAQRLAASRRGAGEGPPARGIWIADTLGELGLWYRLISIVFVGRSLVPPGGGQNPLEPARLGCAVAVGPFVENFAGHVALLRRAGGLAEVSNSKDLADFVADLLMNEDKLNRMTQCAEAAATRYQDLPEKTAKALLSLLS